jgi:eukaryotic-like serine/threonine-protein kinase
MLQPGTSFGRYIVKRKIAEGGMAEIYLATAMGAEGFSKEVVIKAVRSFLAQDRQFVEMFLAEAKLGSRLNHANIVSILDFGKNEDDYYLAMEYVQGASMWDVRKRCREQGVPIPPVLVAEIGAQVARGLHYAHSLSDRGQPVGIVHRDVTPHNILLSFEGAVKLTDFGIAKASSNQTAPGMLKGKFAYMSPEQARGDKVDARTDVFALGIVLWEMLTGGKLFDADTDVGVLRAVQDSNIAPPSRLNPDVPQDLSDIVQKALARELPARFASAFDLERALASFVLRNAQSPEDTSVSFFLQQMFREEFLREHDSSPAPSIDAGGRPMASLVDEADHDMAHGDTRALQRNKIAQQTMTATPIKNNPLPATPLPVSTSGIIPSVALAGQVPSTEPVKGSISSRNLPAVKKGTEQMKSVRSLPKVEAQPYVPYDQAPTPAPEDESPAHGGVNGNDGDSAQYAALKRSNTPLIGGLGLLLVAGVVGGFVLLRSPAKTSTDGPAAAATAPQPTPEPEKHVPAAAAVVEAEKTAPVVPSKTEEAAVPVAEPEQKPLKPAETPPVIAKVETPPPAEAARAKPPESTRKPANGSKRTGSAAPANDAQNDKKTNAAVGTIFIRAAPYATALLDGKKLGDVEGAKSFKVPAGPHVLKLEHPKWSKIASVDVPVNGKLMVGFDPLTENFEMQ